MEKISANEALSLIEQEEPFSAVITPGVLSIKIDRYIPAVCTAIHAGHATLPSIEKKYLVDAKERFHEEDPYTGDMLAPFPIVLEGLDSRYLYDLNRAPENSIYEEAWGKTVWKTPLTEQEREEILARHTVYYQILTALLEKLEKKFSHCIVYDLHAYNYTRIRKDAPLFNIGTHFIDKEQYQPVLDHLADRLRQASIPDVPVRVAFDEVFLGKGYQASFIKNHCSKTLCIPLELKKVYMDESSGVLYPATLQSIKQNLDAVIKSSTTYFSKHFSGKN